MSRGRKGRLRLAQRSVVRDIRALLANSLIIDPFFDPDD
jgi:hypothetical protein